MSKTILVTGSTDGIGLETAKILLKKGHKVFLHGRSSKKLERVEAELSGLGTVESYIADLSDLGAVKQLADDIIAKHKSLDVLINNAGVLKAGNSITADGLDIRFAVNTIAPYLLTKKLLPLLKNGGRVVNLSSAAQAPVDFDALTGKQDQMDAMDAYSQSKLAITMWSKTLADKLGNKAPVIIAVNPGSLLGSKMVKDGFGIDGKDIGIGADVLVRLSLDNEFENASGKYFDNDKKQFSNPHPDALDSEKCKQVTRAIEDIIGK